MPHEFIIAAGLDAERTMASFWAWLHDVDRVLEGGEPPHELVERLAAPERERIDEYLREHPVRMGEDPRRFVLTVAVALLGTVYAAQEKLLAELKRRGLLGHPAAGGFYTVPGPVPPEEAPH